LDELKGNTKNFVEKVIIRLRFFWEYAETLLAICTINEFLRINFSPNQEALFRGARYSFDVLCPLNYI
jgi:hypothetical protein